MKNMKNQKSFRLGVLAALFGALIFVVTAYALHIPTPTTGGYVHLGDAFLYLAASLLPAPYAVAAAAVGEALSDALTGSIAYALPTLVIKAAMALCFSAAGASIVTRRNAVATAAAGLICVGGYYLTEVLLCRSFVVPVASVPANLVQAAASAAIYLLAGRALDRVKLKSSLAAFVR
ncbi:MAG TPA: TIGR04002 family protein [Ruminococcaceae bacterium]|nr:TIGR04002 family protein [Oscillospiraceae bacterium]